MNALDFAIKMEEQGKRFFSKMARRNPNPGVSRIFNMVAEDEAKILKQLRSFGESEGTALTFESTALEGMKQSFSKFAKEKEALAVENDEQAYAYAMKVEQGICEIFRHAADEETDPETRKMLLKLGANGCREALDLSRLHDFVNAPNEYLAWGEFSNLGEFHNFGRDEG